MSTTGAGALSNTQMPLYEVCMPAADEQHLIRQSRNGDQGSFRVLVERHMRQVYNIAYSFVSDHHAAEEIAQEAFVRAHRSLPGFRGESEFGTWIYRIATNLSLNRLKSERNRQRREVRGTDMEATAVSPETVGEDRFDLADHVERALHELPTLQRAVVILRHVDGLTTRQVSSILSCSEGTVKTHLFRGLRKLRQKLEFLRSDVE